MPMRNPRTISILISAAVAIASLNAGLVFYSSQTKADAGQRWSLFGRNRVVEGTLPYNRSSARSWETHPPVGYPTLSKANIAAMNNAIKRYAAIAAKGGWKTIRASQLRGGMRGEAVATLRRRLEMTGDLRPTGGRPYRFDYNVEQAVQRFQARHGLTPTGSVDSSTMMALNVPASARLRQLRINLSRLKSRAVPATRKYVVVNIPAAQIEAVDQDKIVSRHSAVVGKTDRQSPVLRSAIHEINFNPYWNVPASIVRKDLVPKARQYARQGKDVLTIYRIDAYDGRGRKLDPKKINWSSKSVYSYRYRQQPWEDNSMGFVKINFPNGHAVYMHDTPSKSLFSRNFRAHSSGCVRVGGVEGLVSWLLQPNGGWDVSRVLHMKQTGERKDVRLKKRVPVYFAYITAWATRDGTVNFRRDVYRRDGVGVTASAY